MPVSDSVNEYASGSSLFYREVGRSLQWEYRTSAVNVNNLLAERGLFPRIAHPVLSSGPAFDYIPAFVLRVEQVPHHGVCAVYTASITDDDRIFHVRGIPILVLTEP